MGTASRGASSRPAAIGSALNYGTLYPALLKLEQEGAIESEWGTSDNNRKAKFYRLTRAGRKQLEREARNWEQATRYRGALSLPR